MPHHYREFDTSDRLQRIYLDEMPVEIADCSLEVGLIQLFGLNKQSAFDRASEILHQTQQRTSDAIEQQRVLEWIVTVFVHKFPKLSREEIKTMLGTKVELRKTRFYQEIEEETYSKVIPILLESGMSISDIAKRLDISVKRARAIASSGIEV
ncbi:MAG: DUF2887 domain-containing protein [Synechococcales cyanobacterium CRU_2_2]|nr:DUF2887 domain-containing protein [Synechococcales cyanobacterium CRU_2_2]